MLTEEDIEACRTAKGGFSKAQLAVWGVAWPPKTGWKKALIEGRDPNNPDSTDGEFIPAMPIAASPARPGADPHELLRKVVLAVIERGHASDLYEFPDVLAYFGAKMPDTLRNDTGDDVPW